MPAIEHGLGLVERVVRRHVAKLARVGDLVFWPSLDDPLPVAVVVARGLGNPRRERAALKGWQASIAVGRYAHVRYLAGPGAADHLRRLATDIGMTDPELIVGERVIADEPPAHPLAIECVDDEQVAAATTPVAASDFPGPPVAHPAPPHNRGARGDARGGC
jgi:cytochrome P450